MDAEQRRLDPPMCLLCKKDDAGDPCYPGLCADCIDHQMDAFVKAQEEMEEAERYREQEYEHHACFDKIMKMKSEIKK